MTDAASSSTSSFREYSGSPMCLKAENGIEDQNVEPLLKKRKLDLATTEELDSRLWSGLPDDAIERILSRLPIRNLFQYAIVCKKWRNIVSNPSFLRLLSQAPSRDLWFVFFLGDDYERGSAFDPASNEWYPLTFPSFPGASSQGPVAADGGLVCCLVEMHIDEDFRGLFFVCNPLTKDFVQLPRMLTDFDRLLIELPCMMTDFDTVVTGMVIDNSTKAYKVVVAGSNPVPDVDGDPEINVGDTYGCTVKAFLYDSSVAWAWKICGTLIVEGQLTSRTAICNGFLYCVTCRPFGLIAFDVAKEVWTELDVPMPRLLTCCFLTENKGTLIMIGGLGKFGVTTSIHVWRLSSTPHWIKVEKMPRRLCKEFFRCSPSKSFTCVGNGDLLYFHCHKESQAILYDCGRHSWYAVPPCPWRAIYPLHNPRGICFNPRPDAAADGRGFPPADEPVEPNFHDDDGESRALV